MGMFEQLLVKELQRQQHRAQFCDTVLQTKGISVPVHGCVLSAFSPRLCEFLSTVPALPDGKSRVIELQAVESYTLLRLVSALYTGTVEGERTDLQKAADELGITLPPEKMEEAEEECEGGEDGEPLKGRTFGKRRGSKEGEEKRGADRRAFKDAETQIDVTHTDGGRRAADMDTQTDSDITSSQFMYERLSLEEFQSDVAPAGHMSQFPWITDGCFQTTVEHSLMSLPDDVSTAEAMPSTLDDATVCQLFSQAAIGAPDTGPVLLLPPQEDQPVETERLCAGGPKGNGSEGALVEGFEQFEGNIPDFISYFLGSAGGRGRRGQRTRRSPRRAKRAQKRGGERARRQTDKADEDREAIEKVERRFPLRDGLPAVLAWTGVGGGRIGRSPRLPTRKKARPKPYVRQNSAQGKGTEPSQDKVPVVKKQRGRPRVRPPPLVARLPPPNMAALTPTLPHLPAAPSILHTLPLPLPLPTPPKSLLEHILFEMNQPSVAGETYTSTPRMLFPSGSAEARSSQQQQQQQQQPDREVSEMLDHLMQSLEQPSNMRPYTIIKDLQRRGGEEGRGAAQAHARAGAPRPRPPQPRRASPSAAPYRRHCCPAERKTEGSGQKRILAEVGLGSEMFEERRMTRNQAKLLRTSSATSEWASSSSSIKGGAGVPVPKRRLPGKNMNTLRLKLLGKRKREETEEEEEDEEEDDEEVSGRETDQTSPKSTVTPEPQSLCQGEPDTEMTHLGPSTPPAIDSLDRAVSLPPTAEQVQATGGRCDPVGAPFSLTETVQCTG